VKRHVPLTAMDVADKLKLTTTVTGFAAFQVSAASTAAE